MARISAPCRRVFAKRLAAWHQYPFLQGCWCSSAARRRFLPPGIAYPPLATASIAGTHDLPTLKGFWLGAISTGASKLDMYPNGRRSWPRSSERQTRARTIGIAARCADRAQGVLLPARWRRAVLPEDEAPVFQLRAGRSRCIAISVNRQRGSCSSSSRTRSGAEDMINLPGTIDEHPNWRRKMSLSVAEILDNSLFARLTAAAQEARSRRIAVG